MSPITLRASRLAANLASKTAGRRTMASVKEHMHQPAEWIKKPSEFIGHQHERAAKSFARDAAPADWGRIVRFFPLMTIALGWPYAAASVLDGHLASYKEHPKPTAE
ncbi:hypothetical protein F5Y17DRAFT_462237 [Xylariaceae sp. FL0594]|nr:hypothetical protein F5Y17DRAFT_462237 [Xylariaceae sp. FL0594]